MEFAQINVVTEDEESNPSVLFQNVAHSMKTACDQLRNGTGPSTVTTHFNLGHFWAHMRVSSKKLSNEVTKLSLIFSKDPLPTAMEVKELLNSLEAVYVDSLSTFYMLPKEQGSLLHTSVKKAMLTMMEAVSTVVMSLKDRGTHAQQDRLSLTGQVWEACEAFESLPENNLQVLCKLCHDEELLAADALTEIEEEVRSDSLNPAQEDIDLGVSETWNNADRAVLPPCIGLVKTARATLKKVFLVLQCQGKFDTTEQITELDELATVVTAFSPAIDDFIATMYPPMARDSLKNAAMVLVAKIDSMLKMVQESHYIIEDDHTWIDFLLKAVDHNDNKLQHMLMQC